MRFLNSSLILTFLTGSSICHAGFVDFENVPGPFVPQEGDLIGNQYQATEGISFQLADGSRPVLARVGGPGIAFVSGSGGEFIDSLLPGEQSGEFFLTDDTTRNNRPLDLLVSFSNPVSYVSAEILDVEIRPDNTGEAWRIDLYDSSFNILDFQIIDRNTPLSADGIATPFSFSRGTTEIGGMRISYIGDALGGPGFGFDNFHTSVAPIPEPSSVFMLLGCLPGYLVRRRVARYFPR